MDSSSPDRGENRKMFIDVTTQVFTSRPTNPQTEGKPPAWAKELYIHVHEGWRVWGSSRAHRNRGPRPPARPNL